MENTETVLPEAGAQADAGASDQPKSAEQLANAETQPGEGDKPEGEKEAKPEKTPEQREIERMRRKIDRLVRQREELRARAPSDLHQQAIGATNEHQQDDSETVSLSRAELQRQIEAEARKLAPTLTEQRVAIEQRQKVVQGLAKTWGQERFDALAAELDDTFGGLADAKGQPKPATDAIFESESPAEVIEYLTNPDNADEAEALGRMSPIQAGRAIARIESKLQADKANAKPQPSKAAAPIEPVRGGGGVVHGSAPTDMKQYMAWAQKQYGR